MPNVFKKSDWRMSMKKPLLGLVVLGIISGCVFVQPTVEGKKVRVLTAQEVERCKPLGSLTSRVADRVGVILRSEDAIQEDVVQNAKNSAADMGGDTVVPIGKAADGKQDFEVFKCVER